MIHVPDLGLDGAGEGDDGDGPLPSEEDTPRLPRRQEPAQEAGGGGAAVATVEPETAAASRRSGGRGPRHARAARFPSRIAENGDDDWGYTPMSQWGLDES